MAATIMEGIWEGLEKSRDGYIFYPLEFVDYLWENGVVDTVKYSKELWRRAFTPFLQNDGYYKLNKEEFLTLEKYRYDGPIHIPLDAMRINEGKYDTKGLQELFDRSIWPSCAFSGEEQNTFLTELKNQFKTPDGFFLIKADAKLKIKKLLEEHPSPLRRLEILFDGLFNQKDLTQELQKTAAKVSRTANTSQRAAVQKSVFMQGPGSIMEVKAGELKNLSQSKDLPNTVDEKKTQELKTLKRSTKGLRG